MSEIYDPTLPPIGPVKALHHLLHHLCDSGVRAVQDSRVGVALKDYRSVADSLDSLRGIVEPVEADDVVSHVAGSIKSVPSALGKDNHWDRFQSHFLEPWREMLGNVFQIWLGELFER